MKKMKENMNANAGFIIGTGLAVTSFFECMTLRVALIMVFTGWFIYNLVKTILPKKATSRKKQEYNRGQRKYPRDINGSRRQSKRKLNCGRPRYADTLRKKPLYKTRKFRHTA